MVSGIKSEIGRGISLKVLRTGSSAPFMGRKGFTG